jgi:hypothetical protein
MYSTIILVLDTRCGGVLSFTLSRVTPRGRALGVHWIGGWVGPRAGLDAAEKRKSLAPAGNQTSAVQPIGSSLY